MNIQNYKHNLIQQLAVFYGKDHAQAIAWWFLEHATGKNKAQLLVAKDLLSDKEQLLIEQFVKELTVEHKPLQYILGSVDFGPLTLSVVPPTLIPRPETESWVFDLLQKLAPFNNEKLTILDMCTGSGAIGLWLSKALPNAHVYAVDSAESALQLAKHNAHINKITNITFMQSDLFSALPKDITFDLIVSNPPYIDEKEWQTLEPHVKDWEDKGALVASNNGLFLIEQIIKNSLKFLKKDSLLTEHHLARLVIEIGHEQGDVVKKLFESYGYKNVTVLKDCNNKDRVVQSLLFN